ncbi:uracil phosphoribosyltransferase [Mariniflexile sp. HMF6888]|uniref:uracil phosphoribosyltransferase n=1 Tax=Mariniflexile sp. HMF6888 TaxID=3373086 RepID=UPI0037B10E88
MIVHDFSKNNSILNQFMSELRDIDIQKDAMRFRKNIEHIGEVLGYELSKTLHYKNKDIKTPFGSKTMAVYDDQLVVCSVLRAGLTLHQGLLNYYNKAENAFISAYRDHSNNSDSFEIVIEYLASPSLNNKTLILCDPMVASGKTLVNVLKAFKQHGVPKQIHIVAVIGSKTGIEYINRIFPKHTHLWIASIDDKLSNRGYIIPGLGDAGDLSFGIKL